MTEKRENKTIKDTRTIKRESFAGELFGAENASAALDLAAPDEFAMALVRYPRQLVRVVTSPAAHQVATVSTCGRAVALAARHSEGAGGGISIAVIGRFVQVNQSGIAGLPVRTLP